MKFTVEFTDEAKKDYLKLTSEQQDLLQDDYEIIRTKGLDSIRFNYIDKNLFEIKTKDLRSLFDYRKGQIILVAVILVKDSQKTPKRIIDKLERYLKNGNKGEITMKKGTSINKLLDEIKQNEPERYNKINEVVKFRGDKIDEHRKKHNFPEFKTPEEYADWLNNTPQGKAYAKELEKIRDEANKTIRGRGGYRPNAGRKKMFPDSVALNKRISGETVVKLKDYSKKHNISENEALDKLINAGYEHLKEG